MGGLPESFSIEHRAAYCLLAITSCLITMTEKQTLRSETGPYPYNLTQKPPVSQKLLLFGIAGGRDRHVVLG